MKNTNIKREHYHNINKLIINFRGIEIFKYIYYWLIFLLHIYLKIILIEFTYGELEAYRN